MAVMCLYPKINLYVNAILFPFWFISFYSGLNAMQEATTENWNQRKYQNISEIETTTVHYSQAPGYGYTCTFDYGMCGWTQSDQDAFDWTRWAGSTPSRSTGPLSDHTGSGTFYLYIECTGRKFNDNAMIVGPSFYITPLNPYCFSLWYNMYGVTVGTLSVYVKHSNHYFQPIWRKSHNQGQAWTYAEATVNGLGYIQIAIEGFVGRDFSGDIAIDDTQLTSGACRGSPTMVNTTRNNLLPTTSLASITYTSKKPLSRRTSIRPETLMGYNCTFDKSTCGWHQSTADVFDWTRHAGETLSHGTGPFSDHTTNSRVGKYMYIEASSPRLLGDIAKLSGPFFVNGMNQMYCFSFWYNMYDLHQGMGTLNVLVRNEHYTVLKWSKNGNQGTRWKKAEVSIKASSDKMQIVIEGIRGSSYTGDIAIDDTSLRSGKCENTITAKTTARTQTASTAWSHDYKVSEPSGHTDLSSSGIIIIIIPSSIIVFCLLCIVSIRKLRKNSRNTDTSTRILRRRNVTDQPFTISASQMEVIAFHRSPHTTLHNDVETLSADTNRTENQYDPPDYETLYTASDSQETETRRSNSTRHRIQPFPVLSAIDEQGDTSPVRLNLTSPSESRNTNEDTPPPNYWSLQEAHLWQCHGQADDSEPPPYPGNSGQPA